jgi:uncharacterized protein
MLQNIERVAAGVNAYACQLGVSCYYITMSVLDYDTINSAMQRIAIAADAAECHGAITAYICVSGTPGETRWIGAVLPELEKAVASGDALAGEAQRLFEALYTQTTLQMAEGEFAFVPLLPDDAKDLENRATALGHWCQGFLLGLNTCGITATSNLPVDLAEILQDFTEISQLSTGALSDSEEDEQAYAELMEYLKVGAMLFYEEFQHNLPSPPNSPQLH